MSLKRVHFVARFQISRNYFLTFVSTSSQSMQFRVSAPPMRSEHSISRHFGICKVSTIQTLFQNRQDSLLCGNSEKRTDWPDRVYTFCVWVSALDSEVFCMIMTKIQPNMALNAGTSQDQVGKNITPCIISLKLIRFDQESTLKHL